MSAYSEPWHSCRLCPVDSGQAGLVMYGARHWAHVPCLIARKGWAWMLENMRLCPLQQAVGIAYNHAAAEVWTVAERLEALSESIEAGS